MRSTARPKPCPALPMCTKPATSLACQPASSSGGRQGFQSAHCSVQREAIAAQERPRHSNLPVTFVFSGSLFFCFSATALRALKKQAEYPAGARCWTQRPKKVEGQKKPVNVVLTTLQLFLLGKRGISSDTATVTSMTYQQQRESLG